MRGNFGKLVLLTLILFSTSFVLADYSIDISGLKNEEYNLGEEIYFEVVLLDGDNLVSEQVEIVASDALTKKIVTKTITSNQQSNIKIKEDFPSGIWSIKASFGETEVDRTFTVGANLEVEFEIVEDELIIRNKGNVRYTKTISITIGSETSSYAQNIGIGEEKILKLISAEGEYDIVVTDGTNTLRRENIQLYGTGNVVGAVDRDLVGYTGFAGAADPTQEEGQFFSTDKMPLALSFIIGVMILGALVFVERKLTKKKKGTSGSSSTNTIQTYDNVGV